MILALIGTTFFADAQYRNGNDRVYSQNDSRYGNDRYNSNNSRTNRDVNRRVNSFQRDAREHIAQGIVEGTITSREAARLLEMAERIERKENKYKRSGGLSGREVADLTRDLKDLDRRIFRERRDWDRQSNDDFGRRRN